MKPPPLELHKQRCYLHKDREAVAQCKQCGHYFSRECIVEHEGQMICITCLPTRSQQAKQTKRFTLTGVFQGLGLVGSGLLAWLTFSLLGRFLIFVREIWGYFD